MSPGEFANIMHAYRRAGTPAMALEALQRVADADGARPAAEPSPTEFVRRALRVTFFAAAARSDPALLSGVRALLDGASATRRPFVAAVVDESMRPATRGPVEAVADLDPRWSEFFATGDPRPVREIAEVLLWRDLVRDHINHLLNERRWSDGVFNGGAKRRAALAARLQPVGIRVDDTRGLVLNAVDLDCLVASYNAAGEIERIPRLQAALPARLGTNELLYLGMKASALASLTNTGAMFAEIPAVCEELLPHARSSARLSLLSVLARTRLAQREDDAALAYAQEYLAAEPADDAMLALGARAREGISCRTARALLATDPAAGTPFDDSTALRARASAHEPRAFRVNAEERRAGIPGAPQNRGLCAGWYVTFHQERSEGWRWFWDAKGGALADYWVSIGDAHYENPGVWVRFPDGMLANTLRALRSTRLVDLCARPPDAAWRHADEGSAHVALRYSAVELHSLRDLVPLPHDRGDVTLWLREPSGALVATSVHADGLDDPWLECVFAYDLEAPVIEAPTQFVDGREQIKAMFAAKKPS